MIVFITELAIIININIVQYCHFITLNISLLHSNSYTLTP